MTTFVNYSLRRSVLLRRLANRSPGWSVAVVAALIGVLVVPFVLVLGAVVMLAAPDKF